MNRNIYKLMSATALLLSAYGAGAQLITTVAGTGTPGSQAAGGPATLQQLSGPTGICYDFTSKALYSGGVLFIADSGANLVRLVDIVSGSVSIIAGGGTTGLGDGKAATLAQLVNPTGVSTDGNGTLYIADMGNKRIRKVDLITGLISTAAGGGTVYGDGGFAAACKLNKPYHVKVLPSGHILIADMGDSVVRMINASSLKISTVAGMQGNGGYTKDGGPATSAEMNDPTGITIDNAFTNNVYFSDMSNQVIRMVDPSGTISTIAGTSYAGYAGDGGPANSAATGAKLNNPTGIFYMPGTSVNTGRLYVCDRDNNAIRIWDEFGKKMSLSAGLPLSAPGNTDGLLSVATFRQPNGIYVKKVGPGNYVSYVADMGNNEIRMISTGGMVSTLAGNPTPGNTGDDGPAASALLNKPTGVYLDNNGDLLVADAGNNALRKITLTKGCISGYTITSGGTSYTTGEIVTFNSGGVLATGTVTASGGVVTGLTLTNPGTNFTLSSYTAPFTGGGSGLTISVTSFVPAMVRVAGFYGSGTAFSGYGGPALSAALPNPTNVTVDATGMIYVTSTGFQTPVITGNRIVKINPTSGIIDTFYGNNAGGFRGSAVNPLSVAGFNSPQGLAFALNGDLMVASTGDHYIQFLVKAAHSGYSSNTSYVFAGNGTKGYGGLGNYEYLNQPVNIAAGVGGAFFIADRLNHVVRQVDARGVMSSLAGVATYTGDGKTSIAHIDTEKLTSAVAYYPAGKLLFVADESGTVIRKIDMSVTPATQSIYAGSVNVSSYVDNSNASFARFVRITGLDVNTNNGDLFVADCGGNRIRKVATGGSHAVTTVAGTGIYGTLGSGGPATAAQMDNPYDVITDALGNMYVADRDNHIIRKIDVAGNIYTYAGTGTQGWSGDGGQATDAQLANPTGITMDAAGNMYIADNGNSVIRKVDPSGVISTYLGTHGVTGDANSTPIKFYYPNKVLVNKSGTKLYISDGNNHKVKIFTGGSVNNYAGSGTLGYSDGSSALTATLSDPKGLAFSVTEDTLYIADFTNNAVRKIKTSDPTPVITTVAGQGPTISGFTGDGVQATATSVWHPSGICVDKNNNLIIADNGNDRIRRVVYATGIIKTTAGNGSYGYSGDGGQATKAEINNPYGLGVNNLNELLIADVSNDVIRKVTPVLIAQFTETGTINTGSDVCQDSCVTFMSGSIGDIDAVAWTVSPSGPTIASPTADTTKICFPTTGTYVITLTLTAGTSTATSTTTINVSPTPHPPVTRTGHFDLSVPTGYGHYQWYDGTPSIISGAVHEGYTVPTIGNYSIEVDSNGCTGTTQYTVLNTTVVKNTVDKNRFWLSQQGEDQNTVKVYAGRPLDEALKVSMYDASGRAVLNDAWTQGSNVITIRAASLAPGMYLIRLNNNSTSEVLRWMKD